MQTGIGRTGKLFAYEWSGVTPDIMTVAKGIGGGFPLGACLATAEAAKGMTAGTHGSTFGGNPLAMAVGKAVLDVVLADGFLEHVRRMGLYLKQRLAAVVDAHPDVVAEVRGEGLLIGVRCLKPAADVVAAMRDAGPARRRRRRQRRPPAAAADRHRGRDRRGGAAPRRRARRARAGRGRRRHEAPPMVRHFLDLADLDAADAARRSSTEAAALKAARRRADAPKPLAGKTLAMIFEKPSTRTRVSFDVAMRELGGETIVLTGEEMQLGRGETIADTARVLSRYVDAIMIRTLDHDDGRRARRERHRAGDQRPDPALASLPGDGRRDDLRGARGPIAGQHGRLARRRQQRARLVGPRRRRASASA